MRLLLKLSMEKACKLHSVFESVETIFSYRFASPFDKVVGVTGQAYEHVIKPGVKKVTKAVASTAVVVHGTLIKPLFRGIGNGIDIVNNR